MKEAEKTAWIDEKNKIMSFHVIDNGKMIMKAEKQFWNFMFGLTNAGSIKQTHMHTKSAYMQQKHLCKI